jgi:alkanesulfonate monooxygenase SsuD/methylene tetrahydromethanopterin reductase-like flavin-dependent oxidoreductase (luciferase family)
MNYPLEKVALLEQREWISEIERLGYDDLWMSEATQFDGVTAMALATQWTKQLRIGCAAFPVQTRGPALLAQTAASLTHAAPGRIAFGICSSSQPIVEWWNSREFQRPYYYVKDTIDLLRKAWSGEMISEEWESFSLRYYKQRILPAETPPILVTGLREGMIRLGARDADGVILNMCAPEDVAKIVPIVREYGPNKEIALRIAMCPTDDYERGMAIAKRWATGYVTVDSYREQQTWFGRGELIAETNELWGEGRSQSCDRSASRRSSSGRLDGRHCRRVSGSYPRIRGGRTRHDHPLLSRRRVRAVPGHLGSGSAAVDC